MRVAILHPEWARTCEDCRRWLHDDQGEVIRRPARTGLPVVRAPGVPTPCHKCPKIPADKPPAPEHAVEMNEQSGKAFRHWLECRAVNAWPDDPIVRRNAASIRWVYDEFERAPLVRLAAILGAAIRRE